MSNADHSRAYQALIVIFLILLAAAVLLFIFTPAEAQTRGGRRHESPVSDTDHLFAYFNFNNCIPATCDMAATYTTDSTELPASLLLHINHATSTSITSNSIPASMDGHVVWSQGSSGGSYIDTTVQSTFPKPEGSFIMQMRYDGTASNSEFGFYTSAPTSLSSVRPDGDLEIKGNTTDRVRMFSHKDGSVEHQAATATNQFAPTTNYWVCFAWDHSEEDYRLYIDDVLKATAVANTVISDPATDYAMRWGNTGDVNRPTWYDNFALTDRDDFCDELFTCLATDGHRTAALIETCLPN